MNKRPLDMNEDEWKFMERKRKRKSRWAAVDDAEKTVIPGMPTTIPANLSNEQERQYLVHLQIEEISRRLRTGDLGIPPNPEDRSPSPEPIYNNEGKRLNTREYRTRKRLEEERHRLVTEASNLNTEYKPPADYKPPIIRVNDKVMIPQEEHPDINFVGLLIGPRGNTLKNLEKETGAKIIIRGKGSVKEGKIGRKDGQPLPGEDEPLHAYVTANNPENVKKAVEKIKEIIKQGIEVPEGQNDLRRQQLRELALLNGTLRENDGLAKLKQLQTAQTIITNTIVCSVCGGTGHLAQDCKQKRPGDSFRLQQVQTAADKAKMDSEYMSLMAELGEGPPPSQKNESPASHQNHNHSHHTPQQHQFNRPSFGQQQQPPMGLTPPWAQNSPRLPTMMGGPPNTFQQPPPNNMASPMQGNNHQPMFTSTPASIPPWQQGLNSTPTQPVSSSPAMGVQPPQLLTAPPPPPPNSQGMTPTSSLPWLQASQAQSAMPPPPSSTAMAPWQQMSGVPPPPPSNIPPWQQQVPPPPNHQQSCMPNPVAPPPPPPNQHGYSPIAPPPPPPPANFDMGQMVGGINPMLIAPPPPPPS
ncbi:splicing factor 1-like [Liolophura sinensis]|uniref:splicing factor 1-like n=1 Tax=Liolophura sinensis TaxID=3198878 RepID=UPI0031581039